MAHSPLCRYLLYQLYDARLAIRLIDPDDDETLHRFRVALRRVRSLIQLYGDEPLSFPEALKALFKTTNMLREFDVLLLSLNRRKCPSVFKKLDAIRRDEYQRVFESGFVAEGSTLIDAYYDLLAVSLPPLEDAELITRAQEHYHTSLERYASLDPKATRKELHSLRVRFKTSRYALEFLNESALCDESGKIEECKGYQNRFGEIQDLYNQVRWLKRLYRDHPLPELETLLKERKKRLKKLKETSRSEQCRST